MVKRAKLTLNHNAEKEQVEEEKQVDFNESLVNEQAAVSDSSGNSNLGKMLFMAGLTIASLIVFKQKIF